MPGRLSTLVTSSVYVFLWSYLLSPDGGLAALPAYWRTHPQTLRTLFFSPSFAILWFPTYSIVRSCESLPNEKTITADHFCRDFADWIILCRRGRCQLGTYQTG